MTDLDALLASLGASVDAGLEKIALLDASVFSAAGVGTVADPDVAAHTYVGCLGRWVFEKKALVGDRIHGVAASAGVSGQTPMSPSIFSKKVLNGVLYESDIEEHVREFIKLYVRDYALYGQDYVEINVVPKLKRDMFEVEDSEETFLSISKQINTRYAAYTKRDDAWRAYPVVAMTHTLTTDEQSLDGWKLAFLETLQRDKLPEKYRRAQLARFWALVDHTHNTKDRSIPPILLQSFNASADTGVQQSVLRALSTMPFENVWDALMSDAQRLHLEGDWLGVVLGLWANDFEDDQMNYIRSSLGTYNQSQLEALRAAAKQGAADRSMWAVKLLSLLGDS